uniref:Putative acyltransferase n=1 Tax=symbiont bacterium of Paederus fuscipes TaxID=176282 RepID=Q6VT98_UNCXX|nr:putative acyltransferase [symbiont bacterium of Paederus fuscipes]
MKDLQNIQNTHPVVWMFSGQGSQYFQMGRQLYEQDETFHAWMKSLDDNVRDYIGQSLLDIIYDTGHERSLPFDRLIHTHPALFMVQYALAKSLLARGLPAPDFLIGASLGEFIAISLAGDTHVENILFNLIKQARLFDEYCNAGAMLLVIDHIDTFSTTPAFSKDCELAGINFDHCFVVSGPRTGILQTRKSLTKQNIACQLLPVSIAFHSSWMDEVHEIFIQQFPEQICRRLHTPVISCALPVPEQLTRFSSTYWWHVIRQPIAFHLAINTFHQSSPNAVYLDLGPAGNMAAATKYNLPSSIHYRILPTMTPFGRDLENIEIARLRLLELDQR